MLRRLFGEKAERRAASSLYAEAVAAARRPALYADYRVPDTVDGRFEMIALHVYVILRRLKSLGETGKPTAQALFDVMFDDMDRTLREMGAGDLGVGRRVKAMAQAFYGRVAAYDEGLAADQPGILNLALARNVYREDVDGMGPDSGPVTALAAYLRELARAMDGSDVAALLAGAAAFPEPEEAGRH